MESNTQTSLLERAGVMLFALSLAAMGALEAWRGTALPGLHPLPDAAFASESARVVGAVLAAGAIAMIVGPYRRAASALGALLWSAFAVLAALEAIKSPAEMTGWVPVTENAVFALMALVVGRFAPEAALRLGLGVMLIWFGAVHLMNRALIASLIPDWIAYGEYWPWLTGGLSVLAGLACVFGRGARWGALAVALMFASWLPLVHAPRITASIESLFEWTFALTALALIGVALHVAARAESRPRE